MAQDAALKTQIGLVSAALTLYLANNASVLIWNYPFLYCWGKGPGSRLYLDWGQPVIFLIIGFIIWRLLRGQTTQAFGGFILVILVMELPDLFDTIFRLGGSCHG